MKIEDVEKYLSEKIRDKDLQIMVQNVDQRDEKEGSVLKVGGKILLQGALDFNFSATLPPERLLKTTTRKR